MKKIILLTLGLCALILLLTAVTEVNKPFIVPVDPPKVQQTYPYIENDILYTEKRQIPLAWVTDVLIYNTTVRYAAICWSNGKDKGGIFTLQMWELEKIRPQWEQYNAKKKR
jgi:hypothetical protein